MLGHREFEVSSRAKTIDTLRDKLRRDRSTPLASVQDIAGVRLEIEMTLSQQTDVARAIAALYGQDPARAIHDIRDTPHSGYRAVHVWLRLPSRVEVQVRTRMQGAWANVYEAMADVAGRGIRYGDLPENEHLRIAVENMHQVSEHIARYERLMNEASGGKAWSGTDTARVRLMEQEVLEGLMRIEEKLRTIAFDEGGVE